MFTNEIVLIVVFLLHAGLGVFVFLRNSANPINKRFCVFAQALAVWTLFIFLTLQTTDPASATLRLRLVFSAALFIPSTLFFFCSVFPDRSERTIDKYLSRFFFAVSLLLSLSSSFIVDSLSFENNSFHAQYGPLFPVFWFYFITCIAYSAYILYKKSLHYYGIRRLQIQYMYFGVGVSIFLGAITNFVLPTIGIWQVESFGPLATIPIPVAVAYAIVKYHLMDISLVIKRSTVYGTLSIVLSVAYFGVGVVLGSVLPVSEYKETVTAIVSTTVIVLAFVPAREAIQYVVEKTFFHTTYSRSKVLRDSTAIFSAIHDLNELLHFAVQNLYGSVGIERMCILLMDEETGCYKPRAAINFPQEQNLSISKDDAVVTWLRQNRTVLCKEQLSRFVGDELGHFAEEKLASIDTDSCVPIFQEDSLFGIVLLGGKIDRKPFTQEDVQMFLAFSGQLAMAIEKAHLYEGLKEAKTYRDNILQSMKSGVIAADKDGEITLINSEAKRILGVKSTDSSREILSALGQHTKRLFENTVKNDIEFRDAECVIENGGVSIPCGATITKLQTEAGEKLGALMILTDLTEIKRLEAEKQRTDHLASIGVLAANVAHEIKNPLVAINTYFTLLPTKGNDKEFQREFQEIAAKETNRINKIVEGMLNLSRPSKPFIRPIDPRCVVRDAISLLKNVAEEKGIEITSDLEKKKCQIMADEAQTKQVLINILHNAFDAITGKGCVNVSTYICSSLYEHKRRSKAQDGSVFFSFETPYPHNQSEKHYYVCKVSDNGVGIPSTKMSSLFEPFFTTKEKGTGLGLAIIYSILREHKGGIYVQSTEGEGTDFCVYLPLVHTGASVSSPKTTEIPST